MSEFVSAYTDDDSNTVVSVTAAYAEAKGLKTLKSDPPLDRRGRPRGPREGNRGTALVKKTAAKRTAKKTSAKTAAKSTTTTTGGDTASKEGSK